MTRPNKLECLLLAITSQYILTFAGNTRYPRRKHLKCVPIGLALALPSNSKTWLERVSKDKHASLLGLVVSDKGKKSFITLTLGRWRQEQSREFGHRLGKFRKSPVWGKITFLILLCIGRSLAPKLCLARFRPSVRFVSPCSSSACLSSHLTVCPAIWLSVHLSACQFIHLPICPSICLSVCLPACLPVSQSIWLSIHPSICLPIHPSSVHLSVLCPPVCPSVCLSVYLSVCLSVHTSVYLSIRLSVCPSVRLLSIRPSFVHSPVTSICFQSICPPVSPSVRLPVHPSVRSSICLSVSVFVFVTPNI